MLVITKKQTNLFDYIDYQNAGPKMDFLCASRTFCDIRVCNRFMTVIVKAMHTTSTHNILLENSLSDVQMCLNGSGI